MTTYLVIRQISTEKKKIEVIPWIPLDYHKLKLSITEKRESLQSHGNCTTLYWIKMDQDRKQERNERFSWIGWKWMYTIYPNLWDTEGGSKSKLIALGAHIKNKSVVISF